MIVNDNNMKEKMNAKTNTLIGPVSDTKAWNEGYRAEKAGKGTKANPYSDGYADKSYWQMGWEASRRDSNRE